MNSTHTYMQTKYSYTQKIKINKLIFLKERKLELKKDKQELYHDYIHKNDFIADQFCGTFA